MFLCLLRCTSRKNNKHEVKGTSENPVLHDTIFRWGLLGSALDGVGGRMRTARRATRDVDLIRY